jgi:hypothetical protein
MSRLLKVNSAPPLTLLLDGLGGHSHASVVLTLEKELRLPTG